MMATKNPYQGDDKDFFAAARGEDGGIKKAAPKPAAKRAPVVTKDQMHKAGFDNLRDYMNAQKGLTRRGATKAANEEDQRRLAPIAAQGQRDRMASEGRRAAAESRAAAASKARQDKDIETAAEKRKVSGFAKGGKVRGAGIAKKGFGKCKIV
jgi:hypothetical protein